MWAPLLLRFYIDKRSLIHVETAILLDLDDLSTRYLLGNFGGCFNGFLIETSSIFYER